MRQVTCNLDEEEVGIVLVIWRMYSGGFLGAYDTHL